MRILHITASLQGRPGSVLLELVRQQRLRGHEPIVVTSTPVPGGRHEHGHAESLRAAGVPVQAVDSLVRRRLDVSLQAMGTMQLGLGDLRAFDLVHTHAAVPSAMALLATSDLDPRVPVVQTVYDWPQAGSADERAADAAVFDLLDRIVVPSRQVRDGLVNLGIAPERVRIVAHGVAPLLDPLDSLDLDDDDFRELVQARRTGRFVLCCIGPLGEGGNQQLVLGALALLRSTEQPLCLFIGDGPAAELVMLAEALGVGQSVRFRPDKPDRREFLRHTDGLVVPSADDPLPLPVVQAYCDRVPVIATQAPGLADVVCRDACLLFEPHDAHALALAMVLLRAMGREERAAMCARAHALYRERSTASTMVSGYDDVYREVVGTGAKETPRPFAA